MTGISHLCGALLGQICVAVKPAVTASCQTHVLSSTCCMAAAAQTSIWSCFFWGVSGFGLSMGVATHGGAYMAHLTNMPCPHLNETPSIGHGQQWCLWYTMESLQALRCDALQVSAQTQCFRHHLALHQLCVSGQQSAAASGCRSS